MLLVTGDTTVESTETFAVVLSQPTNATIADNEGLGTITNDDGAPPPPAPSVVLTPDPATVGTTLTATVTNGPGNATDWMGLFPESGDDNTFVTWCYLSGTKTPPTTALTSAGEIGRASCRARV